MSILSQNTVTLFNGVKLTATPNYAYTSAQATTPTVGWVSALADVVTLNINANPLNGGNVKYIVEGKTGSGRRVKITSATITASTHIDSLVTITHRFEEIRVGARVSSPNATPTFYCEMNLTEYK